MKRRIQAFDVVPFEEGSTTERGEKVYKCFEVVLMPLFGDPIKRVITLPEGVGITEEWIEDTIIGMQKALEKDFPHDRYELKRLAPNRVKFEYAGSRGPLQ
jgi:hypothetical protein